MSTPHIDSRNWLASQAKSLQFYQELKSQMISTQGVQTNDLPYLPKYKMRIFSRNSFSEKWGVPLESRTQLNTSCVDICMKFKTFEGRVILYLGKYSTIKDSKNDGLSNWQCACWHSIQHTVFQRLWNVIFSPRDITFLILQETYFRGTKIVTQIKLM